MKKNTEQHQRLKEDNIKLQQNLKHVKIMTDRLHNENNSLTQNMQQLHVSQSITEFSETEDSSQYHKVTELSSSDKYDEKRDNDTAKK